MSAAHQRPRSHRRRRALGAVALAVVTPLLVAYGASAAPWTPNADLDVPAVDTAPRVADDPGGSLVPIDAPGVGDLGGAAGLVPSQVPTDVVPFEEPAAEATTPTTSGAELRGVRQIDPQTVDIMIDSPAMGREVPVRLLLPRDYAALPDRKFPALYLLPGYGDPADYKAWFEYTDVEQFFADKDVIVALPSAGDAGFFSDWWNYGAGGTPGWETFHTVELREVLESDWRANDRRAVAGLSMGGFGAISYAARNPGLFDAAASYSGYLHTTMPGVDRFAQYTIAERGLDPYALWGDPVLQAGIWAAHDPFIQAENLRGTELFISSAVGMRGKYDEGDLVDRVLGALEADDPRAHVRQTVLASGLETIAYVTTQSFRQRLATLGIPVTSHFQQEGTHSWGYWQDELKRSWPVLAEGMGVPVQ